MILKEKKWYWFWMRHNSFTTIWNTIYCPPGLKPSQNTLKHEEIHSNQQKEWGKLMLPVWIYLYVIGFPLGLPIFINPWRYEWEMEAYINGSGISEDEAGKILGTSLYGWLLG